MLSSGGNEWDRAAWQRHLPEGVSLESVDLLAGRSLPAVWSKNWRAAPHRPAVFDLEHDRVLSRGDIDRQSARIVEELRARQVQRGDRVLLSAATSVELLLTYIACLRLGAVVVPANPAYRERELGHIVADCDPVLAVIDEGERAAWAGAASTRLSVARPTELAGAPAIETDTEHVDRDSLDTAGPDDLGIICYTSGTTGTPKGAMLSHGNLISSAEALRLAWRWTGEDGLILALPLFHIHGLGVGVNGSLLCGGAILLLPKFDPKQVIRAADRPDASLFFGVPTMYVRLLERLAKEPAEGSALGSLRLLVSGSAPLLASTWQRVQDATGQPVLERYGMSETLMNISNPYEGERRPGTVGLPLPGVETRILTQGQPAPTDEVGDLYLRGPNVFPGYWRRPEATAEVLAPDGWFKTGDMASRSEDGYVTIAGRSKELIITGGYNVYPREVEEILEEHPAVAEAAVVGRPSLEWGEDVTAYVVLRSGYEVPAEELIVWCGDRLAFYKRPRSVAFVSSLPRNAMGKIVRSELGDGSAERSGLPRS